MREARARRIADRGWSHICPLAFRKYCCSHPNVHTKVAEASEATFNVHVYNWPLTKPVLIVITV